MAIKVCLEEVLKRRGMTSRIVQPGGEYHGGQSFRSAKQQGKGVRFHTINRICYFLQCDVGDILKFDGNLEDEGK